MIKRVEINYRGIFQKTLARRIGGDLVLIARQLHKVGFSNGRYSDAPERNGLPSKYFAFISGSLSEQELEAECGGKLDIDDVDVSVILDDTLLRGVEPWAWHGIRPANEKIKENGALVVISKRPASELVGLLEDKPFSYRLGVLDGQASLSGLWVYRDDLTHARALGAVAAADPEVVTIEAVEKYLLAKPEGAARAAAAHEAYESVQVATHAVDPGDGVPWPSAPVLPGWQTFEEAVTVPAVERRSRPGPGGQARNSQFKRGTSKTERPVVRFDLCTKCTLCWLECPDGAFDPTDDGLYDINYAYCSGCGKCAEVCPVRDCIVMVDELRFTNEDSPWTEHSRDAEAYRLWAEKMKEVRRPRPDYVTGRVPATSAAEH